MSAQSLLPWHDSACACSCGRGASTSCRSSLPRVGVTGAPTRPLPETALSSPAPASHLARGTTSAGERVSLAGLKHMVPSELGLVSYMSVIGELTRPLPDSDPLLPDT